MRKMTYREIIFMVVISSETVEAGWHWNNIFQVLRESLSTICKPVKKETKIVFLQIWENMVFIRWKENALGNYWSVLYFVYFYCGAEYIMICIIMGFSHVCLSSWDCKLLEGRKMVVTCNCWMNLKWIASFLLAHPLELLCAVYFRYGSSCVLTVDCIYELLKFAKFPGWRETGAMESSLVGFVYSV